MNLIHPLILRLRKTARRRLCVGLVAAGTTIVSQIALANSRDQAYTLHSRITGAPPSPAVLDSMAAKIDQGNAVGAAMEAIENPAFYNATLKNFAAPLSNQEESVFVPLNDFIATVVGIIRDDVPYTQVLTGDIIYLGSADLDLPPYAHDNNDHYDAMERNNIDLSDANALVQARQSELPGTPLSAAATSGVLTTRAAAQAYFSAGTNRAMLRATTYNFLCKDLEQLKDITRPSNFIRQDVSRAPGGDSQVFLNHCIGCHSGMDAVAGAYAYYDWDEDAQRMIYTPGEVRPKYFINSTNFPLGNVTQDDSWTNYWRQGPNAVIGWNGPAPQGTGMKSLSTEFANTRAFVACQVQKAFTQVCLRPPTSGADKQAVQRIATVFENNQYSMKRVFAETAVHCMGD